jgi:hypothetical protein
MFKKVDILSRAAYEALDEMLEAISLYYSPEYIKSLSNGEPAQAGGFFHLF